MVAQGGSFGSCGCGRVVLECKELKDEVQRASRAVRRRPKNSHRHSSSSTNSFLAPRLSLARMAAQGGDSDAESDCSALSSLSALAARWSSLEEPTPSPLVQSEIVAFTTRLSAVMDVEQEEEYSGHDQQAQADPSTRRSTRVPVSPDAKIGQVDAGSEPSCTPSGVVEVGSGIAKKQARGPAKSAREDKKRSRSKKWHTPRDDDEYEGKHDPALARRSSKRNRESRDGRQAEPGLAIASTSSAPPLDRSLARIDMNRPRVKRPRPSEADMLRSNVPEATLDLAGLTRRAVIFAASSAQPPVAPSEDDTLGSAINAGPSSKKARRKEREVQKKLTKQSREQAELSRDFFACAPTLLSDDDEKPSTRSSKRLRSSIAPSNTSPLSPIASTFAAQPHFDGLEIIESRALVVTQAGMKEDSIQEERKDGAASGRPRREVAELSRDIWAVPSESIAADEKPTTRASKRLRLAECPAVDSTAEDGGLPAGEPPTAPLFAVESLSEPMTADTTSAEGTKRKKAGRKERKPKEERKKAKKGSGGAGREVAHLQRDFFSISAGDALAEEPGRSTRKSKRPRESSMIVSPPESAPTSAAPAAAPLEDVVIEPDQANPTIDAPSTDSSNSLRKRSTRQRRPPARFDDDPDRFTIVRNAEILEEQEMRARMRKDLATKATSSTMATAGPSQPGETSGQLAKKPTPPTLPSLAEIGLLELPLPDPLSVHQNSPTTPTPFPPAPATAPALPAASVSASTAPVKKTKKARKAVPIVPTDPSTFLCQPVTSVPPVDGACVSGSTTTPANTVPKKAPKHPQATKARVRHPALDSRASWVEPERNLTLTKGGRPPIWCEGRQELCETLNYFKAYQGGHCASSMLVNTASLTHFLRSFRRLARTLSRLLTRRLRLCQRRLYRQGQGCHLAVRPRDFCPSSLLRLTVVFDLQRRRMRRGRSRHISNVDLESHLVKHDQDFERLVHLPPQVVPDSRQPPTARTLQLPRDADTRRLARRSRLDVLSEVELAGIEDQRGRGGGRQSPVCGAGTLSRDGHLGE